MFHVKNKYKTLWNTKNTPATQKNNNFFNKWPVVNFLIPLWTILHWYTYVYVYTHKIICFLPLINNRSHRQQQQHYPYPKKKKLNEVKGNLKKFKTKCFLTNYLNLLLASYTSSLYCFFFLFFPDYETRMDDNNLIRNATPSTLRYLN